MKIFNNYSAPALDVTEVDVEQGFAVSQTSGMASEHDSFTDGDWSGDYENFN